MREPGERLRDIRDAISAIERYGDRDKAAFEQDELLQAWFVRHLQIIGEAVRTLPDDIRALAPEIPWSSITGMRHILVHSYFAIDTEIVWAAVTNDIPSLKPAVERLLAKLEKGGE